MLSRASPASTRLRGSELPYLDNPSVKNQRFLPAPFTQGSRGVLPHQYDIRQLLVKGEQPHPPSGHLPLSGEDFCVQNAWIPRFWKQNRGIFSLLFHTIS